MLPVEQMSYHPTSEKLVKVICRKTQSSNPLFFRVHVAFYLSLVASMMRVKIATLDRGELPVNMFAINLATSGAGKGHSTNIIEDQVIHLFRDKFVDATFPLMAEINLPKIAVRRADRKGTDPDDEIKRVTKEFSGLGELLFTFDSATAAAIKQMRHKLLMANSGSMNLVIDEIGSNLSGNREGLDTFLELYDMGKIKPKLVKNTSDNTRSEEVHGNTPANLMLFGTPSKLLNGSKTEDDFYDLLDTGYARRCLFAYSRATTRYTDLTPQEVFDLTTDVDNEDTLLEISADLQKLADIVNVDKKMRVSKDVTLLLIEYRLECERFAELLPEHEEMRKAEISHRYGKALKLAGAYAFVDNLSEITEDYLYYAIKLVEESGKAFERLLHRDRAHVKLAKYIANIGRNVSQVDLIEDLPFYKGSISQKQEMMQHAFAYGYQNNIIIKRMYNEGIEFLRGESLKETDLTALTISYSTDIATGYRNESAPFDKLYKMTQANGIHWCNHHFKDGIRQKEKTLAGFNLVVFDVDGHVNLTTAQMLLKNYKALYYTTKRHTDLENRFRIIMPISHELKMDDKDYKEFMDNVCEWLPFPVDTQVNQRNRKWLSHNMYYEYNDDGDLLDALPFIPKTTKNEARKKHLDTQHDMDNLERWVINNSGDGNRNNILHRFGMILVDAGFGSDAIKDRIINLNDKLPDKLEEAEIMSTIMTSVNKAVAKRP